MSVVFLKAVAAKFRPRCGARRAAFSLVELLVVIGIIGLLLALLIPAVQSARESSRCATCKNNLRQIAMGLASFESAHRRLPPGKKWSGPPSDPASFALAWSSFLLDHVDEEAIHNQINFKRPFTDPANLPATTQVIPVYLCPSTSAVEDHRTPDGHLTNLGGIPGERLGCIDYLGISGPDKDAKHPITKQVYGRQRGVLIGTKGLPLEEELIEPPPIISSKIVDGLSKTMCISECTGRGVSIQDGAIDALHGAWASGNNVTHIDDGINGSDLPKAWYKERIHSDHPGGAHLVMCDASVHFFTDDTSKKLLFWMATRDGEEDIAAEVFDD